MFFRKPKVFNIGLFKTGTTSIEAALRELGYKMGDQEKGELLIHDYAKRNWKSIIKFCKTADAFQDAPFCFPYTYQALDAAFPNSKFILTIRSSAEEWYNSLTKFHLKVHGGSGSAPSMEDLKKATYRYTGFAWDVNRILYDTPEEEPYRKSELIKFYCFHNYAVESYFKFKENLLVINLKDDGAYKKFAHFLGHQTEKENFPWLNKTSEI